MNQKEKLTEATILALEGKLEEKDTKESVYNQCKADGYNEAQISEIMKCIDEGIHWIMELIDINFEPDQIAAIRYGLKQGLSPYKFCDSDLKSSQIYQLIYGLEDDVNIELYYDYNLSAEQMEFIRKALNNGMSEEKVKTFADPKYSIEEMQEIYKNLLESKNEGKLVESVYDEVLEILNAMPDSPFEESEGDIIKDIISTYPNKSSEEIAEIYNDYCETGSY